MPVDPNAETKISAFRWVPPFARGQVRDLRVRWALEEAGIPYSVRKLDAVQDRPADYCEQQPFGQVPVFDDGDLLIFETGAILLRIGEDCEVLLPRDEDGRALATQWLIAALSTVEPPIHMRAVASLFNADKPWSAGATKEADKWLDKRLKQLASRLGDKDWLEGRFTIGDLMMVSVLRGVNDTDLLDPYPNLSAYVARGEARPAFQRALAAQLGDFEENKELDAKFA